jgi:hypothetical protein
MFAPNPPAVNSYLEAEVTLRDGTTTVWKFPRMDRMGYFERCRKERYRKWVQERVMRHGNPDPVMCEAAARFAARHAAGAENPACGVDLVRYWYRIPYPTQRGRGAATPTWQRHTIYTLDIDGAGRATPDASSGSDTEAEGAGGAPDT